MRRRKGLEEVGGGGGEDGEGIGFVAAYHPHGWRYISQPGSAEFNP